MSVIVGRNENGIMLNGLEYLCDEKTDKPLVFESESAAEMFLRENGWDDDSIYWLTFKEVTEARCPRCGWPLAISDLSEYDFTCLGCDEDFYSFEVKRGCVEAKK